MAVFEPRSFAIGSDRAVNCAISLVINYHFSSYLFVLRMLLNKFREASFRS